MMAGSPNWWSMSSQPHQQASAFLSPCPALFPQYAAPSSSLPSNSLPDHNSQDFPQPWSQLLMGGLGNDEDQDKVGLSHFHSKKLENWEDQILINNPSLRVHVVDVKQEVVQSSQLYGNGDGEFQQALPSWCKVGVTTANNNNNSNNILDFSNSKREGKYQHADHSSECDSTATAALSKKARIQSSSIQPPLKVRKEKLGDRITALHQLVSPFGKTDTASVLLEAIGYIRFLQGQIEALSSPYMGNASRHHQHSAVQGERNCAFLEDSGQLLFDNCLKRRASKQGNQDGAKDLRSRGLCLVPISCTPHVGSENGADYWAPAPGGGF